MTTTKTPLFDQYFKAGSIPALAKLSIKELEQLLDETQSVHSSCLSMQMYKESFVVHEFYLLVSDELNKKINATFLGDMSKYIQESFESLNIC